MMSLIVDIFGGTLNAIIGAEIFAPVTALFLFTAGLGFLLMLRR